MHWKEDVCFFGPKHVDRNELNLGFFFFFAYSVSVYSKICCMTSVGGDKTAESYILFGFARCFTKFTKSINQTVPAEHQCMVRLIQADLHVAVALSGSNVVFSARRLHPEEHDAVFGALGPVLERCVLSAAIDGFCMIVDLLAFVFEDHGSSSSDQQGRQQDPPQPFV